MSAKPKQEELPPGVGRVPQWWMDETPHHILDLEADEARRIAEDQMSLYYAQMAAADDAGLLDSNGNPILGPDGKPIVGSWANGWAGRQGGGGSNFGPEGGPLGRNFVPGQVTPETLKLLGIGETHPDYRSYLTGAKFPPGYWEKLNELGYYQNNLAQTDFGRYGRQAENMKHQPSWAKKKLRQTSHGSAIRQGKYDAVESPEKRNRRRVQDTTDGNVVEAISSPFLNGGDDTNANGQQQQQQQSQQPQKESAPTPVNNTAASEAPQKPASGVGGKVKKLVRKVRKVRRKKREGGEETAADASKASESTPVAPAAPAAPTAPATPATPAPTPAPAKPSQPEPHQEPVSYAKYSHKDYYHNAPAHQANAGVATPAPPAPAPAAAPRASAPPPAPAPVPTPPAAPTPPQPVVPAAVVAPPTSITTYHNEPEHDEVVEEYSEEEIIEDEEEIIEEYEDEEEIIEEEEYTDGYADEPYTPGVSGTEDLTDLQAILAAKQEELRRLQAQLGA